MPLETFAFLVIMGTIFAILWAKIVSILEPSEEVEELEKNETNLLQDFEERVFLSLELLKEHIERAILAKERHYIHKIEHLQGLVETTKHYFRLYFRCKIDYEAYIFIHLNLLKEQIEETILDENKDDIYKIKYLQNIVENIENEFKIYLNYK